MKPFTREQWLAYYTPNTRVDLFLGFTSTGAAVIQNTRTGLCFITKHPDSLGMPISYDKVVKRIVGRRYD